MKALPAYPALYQINTRVWLTALSDSVDRPATLDDIPDVELDRLAENFDWVWLLSVWQTGMAAQRVSRSNAEWRAEFQKTLPDLREEDVAGSGFAINAYTVHRDMGGDAALARLRERLRARGLRLLLDFVPNHMAPDHAWVERHTDYLVHGSESDLANAPANYCRVQTAEGTRVLAYGRDPYSRVARYTPLDYGNPALQEAMIAELLRIAGQCDGVRCDMAMLVLPEVLRDVGHQGSALLADGDPTGARAGSRLLLHGRGLLGPRMGAAPAGLRLRIRQTPVRPLARRPCSAGARAFPRRARLPEQARPFSGKPRRAARGRDVSRRRAPGCRGDHLPVPRTAILPPGTTRGTTKADLAASLRGPAETTDQELQSSTLGCSPSCDNRSSARATGSCSSAHRPGRATGRRIVSWRSPGTGGTTLGSWWW